MSQGSQQVRQESKPVKLTGKFAIEIAMPNNRQCAFGPTLDTLRGRWDYVQVAGMETMSEFSGLQRNFPVIHGMCVEVDADNRRLRIYDYYGQPEHAEEWRRLKGHIDKMHAINSVFRSDEPVKETVAENATDDQIKDWAYSCRNLLDKGKAIALTGKGLSEWPTIEQIKALPGKRRTNHFQQIQPTPVYADVVPVQ